MTTVTELLRPLAESNQQFTSVREAWRQFLFYLEDRNGVDLSESFGPKKMADIAEAQSHVDESDDDLTNPGGEGGAAWFSIFEGREDVLAACKKFLEERGLPVS